MTNAFSKDYISQIKPMPAGERHLRKAAAAARRKAVETGGGWGNGTIPMTGTPKRLPPGKMEKP